MQSTKAKPKKPKNKNQKKEKRKKINMALTAHERASAHYRAAKRYMSYGDAPKSKAHMKRALYYGSGNDRVLKLHQDIDQADLTVIKRNLDEVFDVLARLLSGKCGNRSKPRGRRERDINSHFPFLSEPCGDV
jgi:hypothetical protein